jgi:hypothetical protein
MRRLILLFAVLFIAGCSTRQNEALVSLFKYKFSHGPGTICLSVFGQDPSRELLAKILVVRANVVPATHCRREKIGWSYQGSSKAQMIRVTGSHWRGPATIAFDVVHDSNFLFGSNGSTIIVEKLAGFWVPVGIDPESDWIS